MRGETAAAWVRRWVALYTLGLPPEARRDRRDEIEDDLWCQLDDATPSGPDQGAVGGEIALRLLFGIPADVAWRVEQIRHGRNRAPARRAPTMKSPGLGLLAVIGGICWAIFPIPQAIVGRDWPAGNVLSTVLVFTVMPGILAVAGAMGGLAARAQDRIPAWAVALALIAAIAGPLSVFGAAYAAIVVVPVGSALLLWQLARVGAVGAWVARAHVAAAALWEVPMAALLVSPNVLNDPAAAVPLLSLAIPYGVSWIALGVALLRAPEARGQAAA